MAKTDVEQHLRDLVDAIDGFLEYDFEERRNLLYMRLLDAMKLTGQLPSYWYIGNEHIVDPAVEKAKRYLRE